MKEKKVTLSVGLKVTRLLQKQGFRVLLTRTCDTTLPVEDRVNCINSCWSADLIISIHANSAKNKNASGVETYCIKPSLFHGFVSTVEPSLRAIIVERDAEQYKKSGLLAHAVQESVVSIVDAPNRGVRYAIPRMLLSTDIPGALIEVGFLTNKKEALRLADSQYQRKLARGICRGVIKYFSAHNT